MNTESSRENNNDNRIIFLNPYIYYIYRSFSNLFFQKLSPVSVHCRHHVIIPNVSIDLKYDNC